MKLTITEGSENYAVQIIRLPPKQAVVGLDKLVKVTHQGNDVLVGKDTPEDGLYLFFPVECAIAPAYLRENNEYRHDNLNRETGKKGYFEETGRVKAIKFKGIISTGYIAPLFTLCLMDGSLTPGYLKEGDEFTHIDGKEIVRKYKVVRTQGQGGDKDSRFNKKLKRFDKLVPNQFRFHVSTPPLAKCLAQLNPDDLIVITDKWHGTSAVFSNVLIKKELNWKAKLAKFFGVEVIETKYDNLYSSRSVIKNQYINKEVTPGYYNEDIWAVVNKELEGKIEQGITIYGEIVGYLPSGKEIQKGYDYGCLHGEHKFVVYRMTYTKPDGNVIELTWQQIKSYCKKYSIETVKELYCGIGVEFVYVSTDPTPDKWREEFLNYLSLAYLEKDCKHCLNKVPAEGVVVRKDGQDSFSAFKLKSKAFILKESKALDSGEVNIEEDQPIETTS